MQKGHLEARCREGGDTAHRASRCSPSSRRPSYPWLSPRQWPWVHACGPAQTAQTRAARSHPAPHAWCYSLLAAASAHNRAHELHTGVQSNHTQQDLSARCLAQIYMVIPVTLALRPPTHQPGAACRRCRSWCASGWRGWNYRTRASCWCLRTMPCPCSFRRAKKQPFHIPPKPWRSIE